MKNPASPGMRIHCRSWLPRTHCWFTAAARRLSAGACRSGKTLASQRGSPAASLPSVSAACQALEPLRQNGVSSLFDQEYELTPICCRGGDIKSLFVVGIRSAILRPKPCISRQARAPCEASAGRPYAFNRATCPPRYNKKSRIYENLRIASI